MVPTLGIPLGPIELGIVLAIVVVLFGTAKVSGIGKSLGTAINDFKGALKEGKEEKKEEQEKVEKTEAKPEETKPVEANAEETD